MVCTGIRLRVLREALVMCCGQRRLGGERVGRTCGYTGEGGDGERDEDDGEDRDEKVGGHVARLVIVVVGHS